MLENHIRKKIKNLDVVKMDEIYQKKLKENGLYSELIESFLKIGKLFIYNRQACDRNCGCKGSS